MRTAIVLEGTRATGVDVLRRRAATRRIGARESSYRPAPSIRRSSCCCRASGRREELARHRHRPVQRALPGVGRKPRRPHRPHPHLHARASPHLMGISRRHWRCAAIRELFRVAQRVAAGLLTTNYAEAGGIPAYSGQALAAPRHPAALRDRPRGRPRAPACTTSYRRTACHVARTAAREPRMRRPRRSANPLDRAAHRPDVSQQSPRTCDPAREESSVRQRHHGGRLRSASHRGAELFAERR